MPGKYRSVTAFLINELLTTEDAGGYSDLKPTFAATGGVAANVLIELEWLRAISKVADLFLRVI